MAEIRVSAARGMGGEHPFPSVEGPIPIRLRSMSQAASSPLASSANGDAVQAPDVRVALDERGNELGIHEEARGRGWFTKLVAYYMKRYQAKKARAAQSASASGGAAHADVTHASDLAQSAILKACIKSALSGATAGAISTGAMVVTAETEGIGGLVAVPVAAITVGGEMLYRSIVHLELTCDLADIFGVRFDSNDPDDLWRLYALVFKAHEASDDDKDPGKDLVNEVTNVEGADVGEKIGNKVLGESVARNIIPFVGIVSSAITNFVVTRRLGDTVRRYMRYQRAMHDSFEHASTACKNNLDLLVEGMWFIFTADGKLTPEEVATLARFLDRLDPVTRKAVEARFVEDELDWAERIEQIPEETRDHFMHALEVAAAVDKEVGLPERKILRRAAHHLNREFDIKHIERMIQEFEEYGVLTKASKHRRWVPAGVEVK
jgi:hypothetical protein